MNTNTRLARFVSGRKTGLSLAVGLPAMLAALPLIWAEPASRSPAVAERPATVSRSSYGSVRHADTQVVRRPSPPQRPSQPEPPPPRQRSPQPPRQPAPEPPRQAPRQRPPPTHRHPEAPRIPRPWDGFVRGRHHPRLPNGFLTLRVGVASYYYCDGIYYQPADEGYEEVYPPVGAAVPQPPDGAIEIDAGGQAYYYAGGAFYSEQPDGTYAVAPTPIGVVVPELPPGAIQVSVNGTIAYQFNGIYYEPVIVDGETQYETFMP
ncbi:MAG: DUF6515 family protein [Verrucomicrobiota bacterium]